MSSEKISVIIPCMRLGQARELIGSLIKQVVLFDYEIIVVGACADKLACDYKGYNIRAISQSKINPSCARNLGARNAKGDILIFLDDDCQILDGFIDNFLDKLKEPQIGAVSAKIIGKSNKFFARCLDYSNFYEQMGNKEKNLHSIKVSLAIHRNFFNKLNGFDENIPVAEDVDFARRIKKSGFKVLYTPKSHLFHNHKRGTFRKLIKCNFKYGESAGLSVSSKHNCGLKDKIKNSSRRIYWVFVLPFSLFSTYKACYEIASLSFSWIFYIPFIFLAHFSYQAGILKKVVSDAVK
ncbi:MAG: glycosyltransferase [Candidatus Omnitrophota bacterium]